MLNSVRRLLSRDRLDELSALRAAVEAVVRRAPSAVFWDATYPNHMLHLVRPGCLIAAHPNPIDIMWSFYGRFHEAMELRPVERLSRGLQERAKLPSGTQIWTFVGSDPSSLDAYLAEIGRQSRVLFTCPTDAAERVVDRGAPRNFRLVGFKTRSTAEYQVFGLVPEAVAVDDPVARAATLSKSVSWPGCGRQCLEVPMVDCPPVEPLSDIPLPVSSLITDGRYRIEDEGRSRLWTSGMLRVCLGRIPSTFSSISIRFAPSPRHEGIERSLQFNLNGRRVDSQIKVGDGLAAVASISLSPSRDDELTVGIASRLQTRADNGRTVSVCIEGIDLLL